MHNSARLSSLSDVNDTNSHSITYIFNLSHFEYPKVAHLLNGSKNSNAMKLNHFSHFHLTFLLSVTLSSSICFSTLSLMFARRFSLQFYSGNLSVVKRSLFSCGMSENVRLMKILYIFHQHTDTSTA